MTIEQLLSKLENYNSNTKIYSKFHFWMQGGLLLRGFSVKNFYKKGTKIAYNDFMGSKTKHVTKDGIVKSNVITIEHSASKMNVKKLIKELSKYPKNTVITSAIFSFKTKSSHLYELSIKDVQEGDKSPYDICDLNDVGTSSTNKDSIVEKNFIYLNPISYKE